MMILLNNNNNNILQTCILRLFIVKYTFFLQVMLNLILLC